MKQQVRVGILASLLMAPAVLASANEQVNQDNMNPEEIVEQAAVVHPLAVNHTGDEGTAAPHEINENKNNEENVEATREVMNAVASTAPEVVEAPSAQVSNTTGNVVSNTFASTDIELRRLDELKNLSESTIMYDYAKYKSWVDSLEASLVSAEEKSFLAAKIDYLMGFSDIKKRAEVINNELKLLKATNGNTIKVMQDLGVKLKGIESEYQALRNKFLGHYNTLYNLTGTTPPEKAKEFAKDSVKNLPSFLDTTESFLKINLPNYSNYEKFVKDIIKPEQLITASTPTSTNTTELIPTNKLNLYKDLYKLDEFAAYSGTDTYAEAVKAAYDALTQYYTTEFTATEKQIFESHKLEDGRIIKQVLDAFKKDLDAAAKVEKAIDDIDLGINALTAAQFNSKVKAMLTSYEKLTNRQQAMVVSYKSKVDVNGQNNINDLLGAYEVSLAIAALKPTNKDDYRAALYKARNAFEALDTDTQGYVKNKTILEGYEADFEMAVGKILGVSTDGTVQIDPNVGGEISAEGLIKAIKDAPDKDSIGYARKAYDALTANQKKLVNNYKELQDWEKFAKTSLTLRDQIDKIKIEDSKNFASAVQKINTAFNKLTADQQALVTNKNRLIALTPYADAVTANNALKMSNKPEYREDVRKLLKDDGSGIIPSLSYANYSLTTADTAALDGVQTSLNTKVSGKLDEIKAAELIEGQINAATTTTPETDKLTAIQAARAAYNNLSANEKKILNNLKTLTDLEKDVSQPLKVMSTIDAVDPGSSTFASKAKSALTAYDKLSSTMKNYIDNERKAKVENFKRYLALSDLVKALKSTSPTFQKDIEKVRSDLNKLKATSGWQPLTDTVYLNLLVEAAKQLEPKVIELEDSKKAAMDLDSKIESLGIAFDYEGFYKLAEEIKSEYSQLSADAKKLVKNYKKFQQLEKDGSAAYKVIELIAHRTIYTEDVANAGYVKAIENALKAYEKLTPSQKRYVYNYSSVLQPQLRIYEVVAMINQLKPTSKTYIDDLNSVRLAYNALSEGDKKKLAQIYYKLTTSETGVEEVRVVIDLINAAVPGTTDYVKKLQEARNAYENLARISPSYQKLVTNYKTLQDREKALKPVLDSIYQIQELVEFMARPMNDAAIFVSKYNAAVKAYEKVPYESRELIHNRNDLFNKIYPVASTMEAILKIKSNSKTFTADVRKARDWYDALTSSDKALITNYRDLLAFEQLISGGSEVDRLIAEIPRTLASMYLQAIKDARAAYNSLLPEEKNAVTLYKELQNYENGVKNVLAAIDAIDSLQHATNLVSAYDKAQKALDKLTATERQMVQNMNKLQSVGPAMEVYKQIANLKPSQDNYAGAVQAIYSAYNRLSSVEKQYVTNFAQLQEAKNNVDNLASVISKITSITPGSRDYARQVQEALALYNTLPAAMKKMVPNIEMLNQSQKELTAAQKVRSMISEIDVNSVNFVKNTLAARAAYDKLTSNEKRLVSNYFLLEDFEYQLGNMF